jgi:hypothetical protein
MGADLRAKSSRGLTVSSQEYIRDIQPTVRTMEGLLQFNRLLLEIGMSPCITLVVRARTFWRMLGSPILRSIMWKVMLTGSAMHTIHRGLCKQDMMRPGTPLQGMLIPYTAQVRTTKGRIPLPELLMDMVLNTVSQHTAVHGLASQGMMRAHRARECTARHGMVIQATVLEHMVKQPPEVLLEDMVLHPINTRIARATKERIMRPHTVLRRLGLQMRTAKLGIDSTTSSKRTRTNLLESPKMTLPAAVAPVQERIESANSRPSERTC